MHNLPEHQVKRYGKAHQQRNTGPVAPSSAAPPSPRPVPGGLPRSLSGGGAERRSSGEAVPFPDSDGRQNRRAVRCAPDMNRLTEHRVM